MKSSKIAATPISSVLMSEAVRNAVDLLVKVVSIEAQKTADTKAAAERSLERAAFKTRIDEMAAANAALTKTILDLGVKLVDQVVKAEAAREEAAITRRQMAAMIEEAARLAQKTAAQVKTWRNRLQCVLMSVQELMAEVDAGQEEQAVQHDRVENSAPEGGVAIESFVTAKSVCGEREGRCQREEADFVAAATILVRAAGRSCGHQCALSGTKKGPLNDELRGNKSDAALEPGLSPELLFQRQNPRDGQLRDSRESPPSIRDELADRPPSQPKSSMEP
jgi:hypothetical protein